MQEDKTAPVVEEPADSKEEKAVDKPLLDSNKPLSQQVNKLLDKLPKEEEPKDEPAEPEEKPKEEPKVETKEEPVDEGQAPAPPEPEEYQEPTELPTWQKYILDGLPEIQVVGHNEGGKDKIFKVKRVEDLPDDFEFSSKRAELAFNAAVASQEVNARELLQNYNNEQQQQEYNKLKNQEAIDIQSDINNLQKEGILDEFKYDDDNPEFNNDPAVKIANQIYAMYENTNNSYMKAGKNYRITYRDAADKYFANQSRIKPTRSLTPAAKKERLEVANKGSNNNGADPGQTKKTLPPGSSMQDILKLYKMGAI